MNKKSEREEKVYHSIIEIEKDFLPRTYQEKIEEERKEDAGEFGADLAKEFLEDIRHQLAK